MDAMTDGALLDAARIRNLPCAGHGSKYYTKPIKKLDKQGILRPTRKREPDWEAKMAETFAQLFRAWAGHKEEWEMMKEFYPNICKTHSWEDRYITCENVNSVGLKLCVGGIFGLGEQQADRISMLKSIKSLNPMSVPLNFYHPNPSLPLPNKTIDINEGLNLIQLSRKILGQEVMIMVAGGREITFKNKQYDIFKYGANSIIIGNYLTTAGNKAIEDLLQLDRLNYEIATNC
jgi:biotin synthase